MTPRFERSIRTLVPATVVVTLLTLFAQGFGFLTQIVIAAAFGAQKDMDAYLAATTLPQYIQTVILSSLSFSLIPVFVEYAAKGKSHEAWQAASGVITLVVVALSVLAAGGLIFTEQLLEWTAPGLKRSTLQVAVQVAWVSWPAVTAAGLASMLTGIYQAQGKFAWPAMAACLGAVLNLGLVVWLVRGHGVVGVAVAAVGNVLLQAALLLPIACKSGALRISFGWMHSGCRQVLGLLWPLCLSNLLVRCTPVIERSVASNLGEGAISHLGYALRLFVVLNTLLSTAIATVIFPRMAWQAAEGNMAGLRSTVSIGMRLMWLLIAPAVALGIALALPAVTILLQRGRFGAADSQVVAGLVQLYLFALPGMLANITGRTFYALKAARLVLLFSMAETIAYGAYTWLLAQYWGIAGIAFAYALYYVISLAWQLPMLRQKIAPGGGAGLARFLLKVGSAAAVAGLAARGVAAGAADPWLQLVLGGLAGGGLYLGLLLALRLAEVQSVRSIVQAWLWRVARPQPS